MSFVTDQIRRIDAQLDRLQLSRPSTSAAETGSANYDLANAQDDAPRIQLLQTLIKSLSPSASARSALIPLTTVQTALRCSKISAETASSPEPDDGDCSSEAVGVVGGSGLTRDLEWLLLSKATTQIYGQLLATILDRTIPLSADIEYWDSVLSSFRWTALYLLQTSPLRLWDFGKDVYREVGERASVDGLREGVEGGWKQFYGLVRVVVRERSVEDVRRRVVSPLSRIRSECRKKRDGLKRVRLMNANALGVLLGEGLSDQSVHNKALSNSPSMTAAADTGGFEVRKEKWRETVVKSISLMDAVVISYVDEEITVDTFDGAVGSATEDDQFFQLAVNDGATRSRHLKPSEVAGRLEALLSVRLPAYQTMFTQEVKQHERPSRLVRYWAPTAALMLSSGTILRILVNRKAEILTWVQELGATVRDFWLNWIVEPGRKVIGTIRHDEASEVSIMSKRSLQGDRESLERMVIDFAVQNADGGKGSLTDAQIQDVKLKIREGDLTPVLRAYEKDMQSPFIGAVRGNLIQALLIQIQKTKVDVEVALGGVDSILKSQELLFGFIGLTPGLLVCVGTMRWLRGIFGERTTAKASRKTGQLLRQVRNIDRILTSALPNDFGELSYKDQGLLLCEVHLLRQCAGKLMSKQTYRDFLEDVDELVDIRMGVKRQQRVVKRLRWAYARWLR